jgi:hypothetical protein
MRTRFSPTSCRLFHHHHTDLHFSNPLRLARPAPDQVGNMKTVIFGNLRIGTIKQRLGWSTCRHFCLRGPLTSLHVVQFSHVALLCMLCQPEGSIEPRLRTQPTPSQITSNSNGMHTQHQYAPLSDAMWLDIANIADDNKRSILTFSRQRRRGHGRRR